MNKRNFMLKVFSLSLAFILVFPANLFVMGLANDKTKSNKYKPTTSIMGIVEANSTNANGISQQDLLATELSTEEREKYIIEKNASLSKTTGQIDYKITVKTKEEKIDSKITTTFAILKNSDLKDLKVEKVTQVHSDNSEEEIKSQEGRPSFLYINGTFETLGITTQAADKAIVYYLSAKLTDESLAKIEGKSLQMPLEINIAEEGRNVYQDRYTLTTNQSLEEKDDDQSQIKAAYKEKILSFLGENKISITWLDFIHTKDDKEIIYEINLDENQETTQSQIKIECYQATEAGYILNKDYTKTIPFAPRFKLHIPQGYIARIEFTTKAKGNSKTFIFNDKKIQNPAYVEESTDSDESSQVDEDPLPENKKAATSKKPDSPQAEESESEDSSLEISDQDQNPVAEPLDQGQYQTQHPHSVEYTATTAVRNQDGSAPATDIPDFSKNPEVWWEIELDTRDMRDTRLAYDKIYYTLFMGAKDGLELFKYKASTNKQDLDNPDGYITAAVNSTYLYQAIGNVAKRNLGEKLYIRVKAPLDKEKVVHDQYSLGIRVNADNNYINNLLVDFNRKYDSLPPPFKWKRATEQENKFLNMAFDLLDERIVATPQFRKYDVEDQFYYDTTRSITAERFSDTRINWSILDLIRSGEKEDQGLDKTRLNPSNDNIEKFYYKPLANGGYARTKNVDDVKLSDGSLYPGTIVSYNYTDQEDSVDTRYALTTNLQDKEEKFTDIIKNMMTESQALVNPLGGSVEAFTLKRPKSELDDQYFAYYENPFSIMRINSTFDMVVSFNDGIKNPSYDGTGKIIGLQRIEDPDGDILYNTMFGSRVDAAISNLSEGGKFYRGDDYAPEENLKDALKRAYFYADKEIQAWEKTNSEKIPRQAQEMIYQKLVHYITNAKPVTENNTIPTAWDDPNKIDWVNKDETLVPADGKLPFTGTDGKLRQIPENEKRLTANDNNAIEIALRLADQSTKALEDSYNNGDWTEDKADSVNLVFYKNGYGTDYQNLITARVHRPLQVQKLTIDGDKLEGAKFKFTNRYTGESKEWTSKSDNTNNPLYLTPGQYYVEEMVPPAGRAPLDTFIIEVKEEEINPDDGNFPLYKIDIHVNDGYKNTVELVSDPAYPIQKDQTGNPLVSVEEDTLNLNIKNEEANLGSIDFIITNGKRILDGAEFMLTKVNSVDDPSPVLKDNGDKEYEQRSTGISGTFLFRSMPEGTYKLEETIAPDGYIKADTYYLEAKEDADGKVEVKFIDHQIESSRQIVNRAYSTELSFRMIKETEEGEEIVPLDSGVFRLYSITTVDDSSYDRQARPAKSFVEGKDGADPLDAGELRFTDLVEGDYTLEEIQAPTGYQNEEHPYWRVKVTRDDEKLNYHVYKLNKGTDPTEMEESQILRGNDKIEGSTFNITSKVRTISDTFQKLVKNPNYEEGNGEEEYIPIDKNLRGEDGQPVSFRLYAADYYGSKKDPNDTGKQLLADENGLFHLDNLEFSSYYLLEEENPPAGYSKAANTVLYVSSDAEVETGDMMIVARDLTSNTYTIQGKVFKGIIDYEIGDQFADLLIKKTGQSLNDDSKEVGLRRAYFRLYYADADFNYADEKFNKVENQADSFFIQRVTAGIALTKDDGLGNQEAIPDEDLPNDQGIARFEHLKPGNYILVEHRGPAGYEKDPTPRYVKVTPSGRIIKSQSKDDPSFKENPVAEKQDEIIHDGSKKDDSPILPSGEKKITVNFLYNNMDQLGNVDMTAPSEGRAGTMSLQVEKDGKWISDKIQDVPYEGKLEFAGLGQGNYRLVYDIDQINAENWGLPRTTTFAIDLSQEGKDDFRFSISNGNLLRVFNKNETGFRIPLRVTKKDENGSALPGAEFTAKKIIRGSEGIYKEEKFDAVSEATGLAGDNYYRELTPGIYELSETQTPKSKNEAESIYEVPKNKKGDLQKWYFEVKRNPEVDDPRAQNYMILNFKFKHTFAATDDFTEAGKDYKENHIGQTIYGTSPYEEDGKIANEDFMKLIKLVDDDGRSNPARPDAPYQTIDDLEVTNIKKTTKFSFVITDQYAKSLAGSTFRLTKLETNDDGEIQKEFGGAYKFDKNEKFIYQKESKSTIDEPELKFEDVLAGKYLLEEIEAPNGYEKLENPILIEFRISPETGKWEQKLIPQDGVKYNDFIDQLTTGENKGNIATIKNKPLVTELSFKKIDQYGNKVDTSAFSLDKVDEEGDLIDQEGNKLQEGGIQAYHKDTRHWNSNEIVFDNLSEGYYKLEETNPTSYQRPSPTFFEVKKNDQGKLDLVFAKDDENISKDKDGNYQFKNFEKIRFDFTQVGDDGKTPLFGAQFTLKKVLTDKKSRGGKEIYDENGKVVEGLEPYKYESFDSSGSNGKIRFRDLSQGIYELEETAVPYGYDRLHAKRKWIITVENNAKGDGLELKYDKTYEKEYYANDPTYYEKDKNILTIANNGDNKLQNTSNTTEFKFNKVDINGTTIEKDTTFILAKLSANPDDMNKFDELTDYDTYIKLREEDGKFEIKGLSRGIYLLRETNAPQGFYLAERDIILQVVEENKNSDKLIIKAYEYDKANLISENFKYYSEKDGFFTKTINIVNDYKGVLAQEDDTGKKIAIALIATAVVLTGLAYFGIYAYNKNRKRSHRA